MEKQTTALTYFRNSFNCSQSVLVALGPDFGLTEDQCLKVSCAFGGGMGRQQLTCGVVTGAIMALGLKYGKASNDDDSKKMETYEKTNQFFDEFTQLHGSTNCKALLEGLDMRNADDAAKIKERNLFVTNCERYVADAVTIADKLLK